MGQYLIRFKFIKVEIPCIVHDEKNVGGNNTKICLVRQNDQMIIL